MIEPRYSNQLPNGRCPSCNMGLITKGTGKYCPNCSTKSKPSGLVNNVPDLGPEFYKKVIRKRRNPDGSIEEYEDMVMDKAKVDRALKDVQATVPANPAATPPLPNRQITQVPKVIPQQNGEHDVQAALNILSGFFVQAPATTAAQFKKLQLIRKAITKLQEKITEYQGG